MQPSRASRERPVPWASKSSRKLALPVSQKFEGPPAREGLLLFARTRQHSAYFCGAGAVKPSRLAPGSGFALGFGAFFTSFLPLSLFPMGHRMPQLTSNEKTKSHLSASSFPDSLTLRTVHYSSTITDEPFSVSCFTASSALFASFSGNVTMAGSKLISPARAIKSCASFRVMLATLRN